MPTFAGRMRAWARAQRDTHGTRAWCHLTPADAIRDIPWPTKRPRVMDLVETEKGWRSAICEEALGLGTPGLTTMAEAIRAHHDALPHIGWYLVYQPGYTAMCTAAGEEFATWRTPWDCLADHGLSPDLYPLPDGSPWLARELDAPTAPTYR